MFTSESNVSSSWSSNLISRSASFNSTVMQSAPASPSEVPDWHKFLGVALALISACLIGSSFVLKKKGLLDSHSLTGGNIPLNIMPKSKKSTAATNVASTSTDSILNNTPPTPSPLLEQHQDSSNSTLTDRSNDRSCNRSIDSSTHHDPLINSNRDNDSNSCDIIDAEPGSFSSSPEVVPFRRPSSSSRFSAKSNRSHTHKRNGTRSSSKRTSKISEHNHQVVNDDPSQPSQVLDSVTDSIDVVHSSEHPPPSPAALKKSDNEPAKSSDLEFLKSKMWWTGMLLMLFGEILNFVAYAFAPAVVVTPLGAGSVVISAVLSHIFLKEKLNFTAKIGCAQCLLGAILLVMNVPADFSTTTISSFWDRAITPGYLSYTAINVVAILVLIFYAVPRWGSKWPIIYITICSLMGSFVVVACQGTRLQIF